MSASPARGAGSSWRRTRSGATAKRGRISMVASPRRDPRRGRVAQASELQRRSGSASGHPNGPPAGHGEQIPRFGRCRPCHASPRPLSACTKIGQKLCLAPAAPGEDEERVAVERLGQQEIDRGDVLARVLPVRDTSTRSRNRRAEVGNRVPDESANASSISSGMSPARSLAMKTALDAITASAASHSTAREHRRLDRTPGRASSASPAPTPSPARGDHPC